MATIDLGFKVSRKEYNKLYYKHSKEGTLDDFLLRGRNDGRSKNKEHLNKINLAYFRRNPEKRLWCSAKLRAKKRNLEFSIECSDIFIPDTCPVLGIPLRQGGYNSPNSPSLDRIDNTKGYTKSNIQVISHRANTLKSDASLEELELLVNYLQKIKNVER